MTTHVLQYDLGLRLWVLCGPQGEVLSSYLSRQSALRDPRVRRIRQDGDLRIRNADGTFEPMGSNPELWRKDATDDAVSSPMSATAA